MKKLIAVAVILVTVLALMVPVFASADAAVGQDMWVNCADGKRLNVRTEPRTGSTVMKRLDCGTKVTVLNIMDKDWVRVTDGKLTGYVMVKFLVDEKPGKYEITERDDNFVTLKKPYIVTAQALNDKTDKSVGLRVKPNKTAKAIRRLTAGDQLQVIARGKVWSRVIDLETGKTGYVANDYIRK